jgi:hypothetical protein
MLHPIDTSGPAPSRPTLDPAAGRPLGTASDPTPRRCGGRRPVPTGTFEIELDGTILHFRPYEVNGLSIDELEGRNLFDDLLRSTSGRDAARFATGLERGETTRTSRHLLHGRDLALILLHHEDTQTYWGFLGPA